MCKSEQFFYIQGSFDKTFVVNELALHFWLILIPLVVGRQWHVSDLSVETSTLVRSEFLGPILLLICFSALY